MSGFLDEINEQVVERVQELPKGWEAFGIRGMWTGFKVWPDNALLIGQWLAYPTSEAAKVRFAELLPERSKETLWGHCRGIYSSTPGKVAPFAANEHFDVSPQEGQAFLSETTLGFGEDALLKADAVCREAFEKLEKYLQASGLLVE